MSGVYFQIDAGNGPVALEQVRLEVDIDPSEYDIVFFDRTIAGSNVEILQEDLKLAEFEGESPDFILFLNKFLNECRRIPNATVRIVD